VIVSRFSGVMSKSPFREASGRAFFTTLRAASFF